MRGAKAPGPARRAGEAIRHTPTVFVLLAALCWGVSGGIAGLLLGRGWDPFVVSFYRGAVGLAFFVVWLAVRPRGSGLSSGRLWFWSAVAGLGVAGNFAFYFVSIREGSVAVAATLMYASPVFVYLVSFAAHLERPSPRKWIAIAVVIVGIVLLTRVYAPEPGDVTLLGLGAGLLSGLSYALFIFGFKYASPRGSPQAILVVAFSVLVAVLVWPSAPEPLRAALAAPVWPAFLTLGVLGAGVSFMLYVPGLRQTAPTVAAIVAMVEPVTAAIFGWGVLGQSLAASQLVGMGLVLGTVTAMSARPDPRGA